jgi:hypothetical protein
MRARLGSERFQLESENGDFVPNGLQNPRALLGSNPLGETEPQLNEYIGLKSSIQSRTYDLMVQMHTRPNAQRFHRSRGLSNFPLKVARWATP